MIPASGNLWAKLQGDLHSSRLSTDELRVVLVSAVLAPSERNTQPWQVRLALDRLELLADRTRRLPVLDPADRELTIACGTALLNLRLALRHLGYSGAAETLPDPNDPDLLALVKLEKGPPVTPDEQALFEAIPKRHTYCALRS